jgi:G6PDH family F420-dependent oxidoreductase
MTSFGYTLSSEEHPPRQLVANSRRAEELGFDFVSISDHFHPWVTAQGHSPFVWSVLGGIAASTERLEVGVGVTCPTIRIHPAILAQATATTSLLFGDRFFWGVGTGEALNEHVLGDRWPRPEVRLAMLEEAIEVVRRLWTGETVDHHGTHYEVENARLFDPPDQPPPVIVSGFGDKSVKLAARIGDGFWGHSPEPAILERFAKNGGTGPRYAQINVCWAPDESTARKTVYEIWPNSGIPGQLAQDLPTWTHFEQAAELVTEEDATTTTPCGPDVEPVVESVRSFVDAGYDHLYFHQIGPDQDGFFRFWERELRPALGEFEEKKGRPATMPSKSANVKNKKQYEALKDKGMSKSRAARIANSPGASKRGGKKSGSGGNSKQGGTTAQHKTAGRKGGTATAGKS